MKDFLSDAKANAILSAIITLGAHIIGSIYYFQGKGSVTWMFCLIFFLIVFVVLFISTRSYNDEYKAEKLIEARRKAQIQEKKEAQIKARISKAKEYDSLYGSCTKEFPDPMNKDINYIRVYESSYTIIIKDIPYNCVIPVGVKTI